MHTWPGLKLALIALAVVASGRGGAAAALASASCVVIEPVSVTKSADLASGKVAAGAGAPAVTRTWLARAGRASVTVEYN
ncbi:MAG TPA: hypothetical protein VFS02_00215 [Telluria sp.]|nr:hypothetical protein [Telluria sp.]